MHRSPEYAMKKTILTTLFLLLFIASESQAQRVRARWKAYRYEWSFGLGASNFLGELGGANQIGTNGFKDLELSQTRPAISTGLRYKLSPNFSLHTHLTWGSVRGDDNLTSEPSRKDRNLNFKSDIFEFNVNFEAALLTQREGGVYRLKGVKRSSGFEGSVYAFVGIGVFKFNPKGQIGGKWYELRDLGTEGQGISPSRSKYSLVQLCVPIGIGGRYFFNRRWGVGLEFGIRKTFTDYIDDVSKTYYENQAISSASGPNAAILADPSITRNDGINDLEEKAQITGQQRGDASDKDAFMFATFSIHYKLRTGKTNFPIF